VLGGAEEIALFICAAVMEPAGPVATLLQAVVVHRVQAASGIPPTTPAFRQSIARGELIMPVQGWPYKHPDKHTKLKEHSLVRNAD